MPLAQLSANHIGAQGGGYEPVFTNAFTIIFVGLEVFGNAGDLLSLNVQSVAFPKETTAVIEVPYRNEVRKFAGKTTFDDLQVQFIDYVDRAAAIVLRRWRKVCYDSQTGSIGRARDYKKRARIEYGARDIASIQNGEYREQELRGVWLSQYDGGDGDYGNDDVVRVSGTLTYDTLIDGRGLV